MKKFLIAVLFPFTASAFTVPMESFDQLKLEQLLRRISLARVDVKDKGSFVQKTYAYPKKNDLFMMTCTADHYNKAPVPSNHKCEVTVNVGEAKGLKVELAHDQYKVTITDTAITKRLHRAISFGDPEKKLSATEQTYGGSFDGTYGKQFRYQFLCKEKTCSIVFLSKPLIP